MSQNAGWHRVLTLAALVAVGGCGDRGPQFEPVRGQVMLDGKPLTIGSVSFRPDTSKGNKSLHHPTGPIDANGSYELFTTGKSGAPPGWYKVLIFADANASPNATAAHPLPPKWLVPEKFTREATTELSVEVVADAEPGRYDLRIGK